MQPGAHGRQEGSRHEARSRIEGYTPIPSSHRPGTIPHQSPSVPCGRGLQTDPHRSLFSWDLRRGNHQLAAASETGPRARGYVNRSPVSRRREVTAVSPALLTPRLQHCLSFWGQGRPSTPLSRGARGDLGSRSSMAKMGSALHVARRSQPGLLDPRLPSDKVLSWEK